MEFYRNVKSRLLGNGARVFVLPMPGAALEVQCFVATGGIHEGESLGYGLSHFLEHMLFEGCRDYPGNEAADTIDRLGGFMNAYTSYDHTAYHVTLGSRHLDEAVKVLSSMVRYPEFPEKRFAEEREVILREAQLGRDKPERELFLRLFGSVYRSHALRFPIIGYPELIAEVDRDRMMRYYEQRYTPGRTFFVIVGDVGPEQAFDAVERQLGDWKRSSLEEPNIAPEPPQSLVREEDFTFADSLARLGIGTRAPEGGSPDLAACDVLCGVLGLGDGSRLVRKFELQQQLAVHLRSSCYNFGSCTGLFSIHSHCVPSKLGKLERALRKELESIRKGDISKAEVEREKVQQYAEQLRELRDISAVAANIGSGVRSCGAPELHDSYIERLGKVTVEEVQRVAAEYFHPDRLSIVRQHTAERQGASARKQAAPVLTPELTVLDCGVRLTTVSDRRLPLVDFSLLLPGGTIFETAENGGISGLTSDLLCTATERHTEDQLLTKLDECGANVSSTAGLNSLMLECSVPRRHLVKFLPLLKEIVCRPVFRKEEFEREKANRLERLKSSALTPRNAAVDRCRELLYGSHPYSWGTAGTEEQIRRLTLEAVGEFYFSRFVPGQTFFGWGGDCTAAEAAAWTEELCGALQWRSGTILLPPEPVFPKEALEMRIPLPREQTFILQAVPGPTVAAEASDASEILLYGENGLSSPVFKSVREHNQLAYDTGFRMVSGFHPGYLMFYAATTAESAGKALELLDAEQQRLAAEGFEEAVFNAARESAAFTAARQVESPSAILRSALLNLHYGRAFDECLRQEETIRSIGREEFHRLLRPYLSNQTNVRVFAGRLPEEKES